MLEFKTIMYNAINGDRTVQDQEVANWLNCGWTLDHIVHTGGGLTLLFAFTRDTEPDPLTTIARRLDNIELELKPRRRRFDLD